ncbi:MAG: YhdP family protein [Acidiferrobacterales bacterium]
MRKIGYRLALGPKGTARLETTDGFWKRRHRPILRFSRWVTYASVILVVFLAACLVVVHAWLPTFAGRTNEIATYLSRHSSYRVQIDRSEAYWHGLNPGLQVYNLAVYSPDGQHLAVQLKEVRITLAWLPLLVGRLEINNLILVHPNLAFERLADGRFRITGLGAVEENIPAQGEGFLPWLFQQNDVAVEDGEMQWVDHTSAEAPLRLSRVNLSLRNSGNRHHLQMTADFPPSMCQTCAFTATVTGDPLTQNDWHGEIDVQAEGLSTYALPKIVREKLPIGFDGRFDVRLSSEWDDGVPMSVKGHAGVSALKLALPGIAPFDVNAAAADVKWIASEGGARWRLDLSQLRLGLASSPWFADKLRIQHRPDGNLLFVKHINIDDLNAFLSGLKDKDSSFETLRAIRPGGGVDNLKVELDSTPGKVASYTVDADLRGLRFDPYGNLPGVRGLTGHLSFDRHGGEFALDSKISQVSLPRIVKDAIGIRSASGRITWQRDSASWRVRGEDLAVSADDARLWGSLDLRLPDEPNSSPQLKLRVDFSNGHGENAARYYPNVLHPGLREWLKQSVVSGTVTSGHLIIDGTLADFPYRAGNGRFEVLAHVHNGVFRYLPGWPSIRDIDADLLFKGAGLTVTGRSGTIGGLSVGRVAVTVDDLAKPGGPVVRAGGQVSGPLDQTLLVLSESNIRGWSQFLMPGMHASGQGVLNLDLAIPAQSPEDTELDGLYAFHNAALNLPLKGVSLESINGALEFNRRGLSGGAVHGKFLGGNASLSVATDPGHLSQAGTVTLKAQGTLTDAGMRQALGSVVGDRLTGDIPWSARLQIDKSRPSLDLAMDLQQLGVRLPAPLDKPTGVPAELIVKTRRTTPDSTVLDMTVANQFGGRIAFRKSVDGRWGFSRGTIEIGDGHATLSDAPGLRLNVHTPGLDGDRWWHVIKDLGSAGSSSGIPGVISGIDVNVGGLYLFRRRFGTFAMTLARSAKGWHGMLSGDAVNGTFDVHAIAPRVLATSPAPTDISALLGSTAGSPPSTPPENNATGSGPAGADSGQRHAIYLALQKLIIPPQSPAAADDQPTEVDPRSLPELHVRAQNFQAWGKVLGSLELDAIPTANGWHVETFHLAQPNLDVRASGDWQIARAGGQSTTIQTQINSDDFGRVLGRLGYPGELARGKLAASGQWSWVGGLTSFSTPRLNGSGVLSLNNGRLPKISPGGAGRLLGLIDTRALTRYLVLDFSNVFGKGFTFDSIRARVTIENGNAYTQDLTVKGPSANIGVTGRLGLATRDMDLGISIVPRLGDQLTMTGILLGGPVVGAAVAVARDILKRPLEQGTRMRYTVNGSWDDPKVFKGSRPALPALLPDK